MKASPTGRCYHHQGLPSTEAELRASRENPLKHGYFVTGFLDEEERSLFQRVLEGDLDPGHLKRQVIAALVVRAARVTKWEAEGEPITGFATDVFAELRKALDSVSPDELRVSHSWDQAEVAAQVREILREDVELTLRLLPEEVRGTVREALDVGP